MNKKGFTIVELIVSFSLAAMIGFFLLRITMVIKDLYTDSYVKTNIMSKQNIMTERMYDDFLYNDVKVVLKCGNNCLRFIFSDNSEKIFEIENENTFKWGDFTLKLTDGSKYSNATTNNRKSLITTQYNDSLLSIKIPIINNSFKNDTFITNIVVPYNSEKVHMDDLDFANNNFEHYMVLKEPGTTFLDVESIFSDPGIYVYYGKTTCSMKNTVNYENIKKNGGTITNGFEGDECSNLNVQINYSVLRTNKNSYIPGEYDIEYKLYIDGTYNDSITRHITVFEKIKRFPYNGTMANNKSIYTFVIPMSGYYMLETWGASGIGSTSGYGAYATLTARFQKGEKLYVYVGQMNNSVMGKPNFNTDSSLVFNGYSGGGATDIRISSSEKILVAGGGGSGLYNTGGYGTVNGSSYGDSNLSEKSNTTCGSGGGYNTFGSVSCSDKASGGTSYVKDSFVFNGRTINIISGNAKYNKNIIAGNKAMKNPYTGINSNHGNDGDGYAIITFIGDKLD